MACCNNCAKGRPCGPQPVGADKYHQGGVTQLQYVGDDGTASPSTGSTLFDAVKYGLLFMGVARLLGAKSSTSRWLGVAGVGFSLAKKGWEG